MDHISLLKDLGTNDTTDGTQFPFADHYEDSLTQPGDQTDNG